MNVRWIRIALLSVVVSLLFVFVLGDDSHISGQEREVPTTIHGDAGLDGSFGIEDLNLVIDWLVGRAPMPAAGDDAYVATDVDGDSYINLADLHWMIMRLLGQVTKFPVESMGNLDQAAAHREKAMSLLNESLAISSELGMRPLMERVLSRQEILGA